MRWQNILLIAIVVGIFEFFMVNCGAAIHEGSYTSMEVMRQEVFKTKVHSALVARGCANCHNDPTRVQFTSANTEFAYFEAKSVVNFQYPEESILYKNAFMGHCQMDICSNKTAADSVLKALKEWATLEAEDPLAGVQFVTETMPVAMPSQLPLGSSCSAQTCVVRFDLSQMERLGEKPWPVALHNALLELQLNRVTESTYQVSNPKILGSSAAVKLKGVRVYMRPCSEKKIVGSEYKRGRGQAWVDMEWSVEASSKPATLPQGPLSAAALTTQAVDARLIAVPAGASCTGNEMAVGIEDVEP